MTVITKPIDKKATQNQVAMAAKALANKGEALAKICIDYAQGIVAEEEKRGNKQKSIAKSISELTPEGHKTFRAGLADTLAYLNEVEKSTELGDSRIKGYSTNTFRVMMSNYKSISIACELGLKVTGKEGEVKKWVEILSEAVAFKHANAASDTPTIKPGRGRKTLKPVSAYDKAVKAVDSLDLSDLTKLSAHVGALIATLNAQGKTKSKAIQVALV